jgi:hypothetical protein
MSALGDSMQDLQQGMASLNREALNAPVPVLLRS